MSRRHGGVRRGRVRRGRVRSRCGGALHFDGMTLLHELSLLQVLVFHLRLCVRGGILL